MLDLLESLASKDVAAAEWVVCGVVAAFVVFVGITLAVALFHPDPSRSKRAHDILHDLLALFGRRRTK
jgi:hypothetical protein